ncbi:MAG TPA: hypothetical protein VFI16_04015 [Anaeromyxobacteraceae bacterium]|nr:hypothetical protein [Anaeromyxobacteraceae bacterium]
MAKTIGLATAFLCLLAAAPARAQEVAKADWIETMKTALPTAFCAEGAPFRTCFAVTHEECEDTAASAVRLCLKKFQSRIPARLKQPEDGTKWGQKIGECTGNSYAAALVKKKLNTKECR